MEPKISCSNSWSGSNSSIGRVLRDQRARSCRALSIIPQELLLPGIGRQRVCNLLPDKVADKIPVLRLDRLELQPHARDRMRPTDLGGAVEHHRCYRDLAISNQ